MQTLKFSYPRRGLSGEFATFRLSRCAADQYPTGTPVALVDSRSLKVLLRARVTQVHQGTLAEMAQQHGHLAHNWQEYPVAERPSLLVKSMMKRYPPGRCTDESTVTVLYLKEETENECAGNPEDRITMGP